MNFFLVGGAIGLITAAIGALIEYWLRLRPGRSTSASGTPRQPSLVFFAIGGLIVAGLIAIVVSLILTGGLGPALIMGFGVFVGFNLGFFLIALIWILPDRKRPKSSKNLTTSTDSLHEPERLD